MKKTIVSVALTCFVLLSVALCVGCANTAPVTDDGNQGFGSTETGSVEIESPEPVDPEPATPAMIEDLDEIPEDIAEAVRTQKGDLKNLLYASRREEMPVDNLEIGQRIKKYWVTEDGVEEFDVSWPIYIDGELVALLTEYEALGRVNYDWDVNTPPIINAAGLDTVAIVFDYDRMYLSDGARLIETEMVTGPVESRVPVTEENEAEIVAACELGRLGAIIGSVTD